MTQPVSTIHVPRVAESHTAKRLAKLANKRLLAAGHTTIKNPDEDCEAIMAFASGRAVGILTFARVSIRGYFYVEVAWINPRYRKRGIFTRMIEHVQLVARRRRVKLICLEVNAKNLGMQSVMAHLGKLDYLVYEVHP